MLKGVGIPLEKCFKSHNFFFQILLNLILNASMNMYRVIS